MSPETCEDLGGLQICGTEILVSRTNSRGYFSDFLPGGTWRVEVGGRSFPVNVDGGLHPVVVSESGGLSLTRNLIISDADERVLYVTGTNNNDSIELRRSGASIVVNVNQEQQSHSLGDFDRIELQSLNGADTITIHFGAGNPIPDGGIEIDGGSGSDSTGAGNRLILNGTQVGPVPVRFGIISMDSYAEGAGILDLDDTRIHFTGLGQGDVEARRVAVNDYQIGVDNDGATTFHNTLHISPARELVLGANDGSSGRYMLAGDSLLNVDVARIGSHGTGELTVETPTAWFFANRMTVGEFSTGVVRQTDGYVLARESLVLGASPGAEGTYFLDGGLIDVAALQGGEGQGTLHIRGGALVADSIDVPVIQTAGIFSPDDQNGPVAISDYTMRGGTLALEIHDPAGERKHDRIQLNGPFVAGGALTVDADEGYVPRPGDTFDFFEGRMIDGTFDSMNLPRLAGPLAWDTSSLYATGTIRVVAGDLQDDDQIDSQDINQLSAAVASGTGSSEYDADGDGLLNSDDVWYLVRNVLQSDVGDVNFDGRFDSVDFVSVFQTGEYEDLESMNSTWTDGDWNCDGEFNSSDMVLAFQAGWYESAQPMNGGPIAAAVDAVFFDDSPFSPRRAFVA